MASPEIVELAHRLAAGARAQALRDQLRLNAILALPTRVYHVTDRLNYELIQREDCLRPANELYERARTNSDDKLLTSYRPSCVRLSDGTLLRDQAPMPPRALKNCLVAMCPEKWYALLNSFVFFWFDRARAEAIKEKYSDSILLAFEFRKLLFANEDFAFLTSINTGSAAYGATKRCRESFVPFKEWTATRWKSEEIGRGLSRKRTPKAVEFAIKRSITNMSRFLISEG